MTQQSTRADAVARSGLADVLAQIAPEQRERIVDALARAEHERAHAEALARFLEEAGAALASSLDDTVTLEQVARLAVPGLADWCAIEMLRPDDAIELVAVAHAEPEKVAWARELRVRQPTTLADPGGVGAVLRTGQAAFYPQLDDAFMAANASDEGQLALGRQLGVSALMIVPLLARGQILGAITLISAESGRRYDDDDLALAHELARRAAIAVDNGRLYRAEQEARASLEHVLTITPAFHDAATLDELAATICRRAVEVFECTGASLWHLVADGVVLLSRTAESSDLPPGTRIPREQMQDLYDLLVSRRPAFVPQPSRYATDLGDFAERERIASALLLPIVIDRRVESHLSLTWTEPIAEPSAGLLVAAQRYADQAGLALENLRRRSAQRQSEALTASLDRLLELSPSFWRSGGRRDEVALAIVEAAIETFGADAAALWESRGDRVRLIARRPDKQAIPRGQEFPAELFEPIGLLDHRTSFVADVPACYAEHGRAGPPGLPHALLRAPLLHGGSVEGALAVLWDQPVRAPSAGAMALLQRFADQSALAMEEAHLREIEQDAAVLHGQLEASLLSPPQPPARRVQISRLYRAGEHRMLLGGDFIDSLELPDGRLALVIGDVSGHGPAAAALGAALRVAWRTLVLDGADASRTLAGMNALLLAERRSFEVFATVAVAWIDADRSYLTLALAGHPPPLLLGPEVRVPRVPGAPPLGVGDDPRGQPASFALTDQWGVLLYTDGLVEGRAAGSGRLGLEGLRTLLAGLDASLTGDEALAALFEGARAANGRDLSDDVALLLVRAADEPALGRSERAFGGPLSVRLQLPAEPASVPRVRHELVDLCHTLGVEQEAIDAVALAVTEAVTNVLMHAYHDVPEAGLVEVEAWPEGDRLRVIVRDFGRGMLPRTDSPGLGLGMQLIATFAEEVDVRSEHGTAVTEVVMLFRMAQLAPA